MSLFEKKSCKKFLNCIDSLFYKPYIIRYALDMPRIAVLSDPHFSPSPPQPESARQTDLGLILLRRAVRRINEAIKPDVTVILGDLLNLDTEQSAPDLLQQLKTCLSALQMPWIAIPGNHDGPYSDFINVFGAPPDWVDVADTRFLPFLDEQAPGYNAIRSQPDLDRFARAREGWPGQIVSLQHVPLIPPTINPSSYHLLNISETLAAMHAADVKLALSGHYHTGIDLVSDGRAFYAAASALCEAPFAFLEINLLPQTCSAVKHELTLPSEHGLFDGHTHSHYAYCSENMDVQTSLRLARLFHLGGLAVTEHADHLYVNSQQLRRQEHVLRDTRELAVGPDSRMHDFWINAAQWRADSIRVGLEVPANFLGSAIVIKEDLERCDLVLGAIHHLRELKNENPDARRASEEYLGMLRALLKTGIHVLAHPFRIFRWSKSPIPPPSSLLEATADLLLEYGVAAELNSHKNEPIPAFVEMCLERGVPLALGSDAHEPAEVGYLFPQIDLIQRLGGKLSELMKAPPVKHGAEHHSGSLSRSAHT